MDLQDQERLQLLQQRCHQLDADNSKLERSNERLTRVNEAVAAEVLALRAEVDRLRAAKRLVRTTYDRYYEALRNGVESLLAEMRLVPQPDALDEFDCGYECMARRCVKSLSALLDEEIPPCGE